MLVTTKPHTNFISPLLGFIFILRGSREHPGVNETNRQHKYTRADQEIFYKIIDKSEVVTKAQSSSQLRTVWAEILEPGIQSRSQRGRMLGGISSEDKLWQFSVSQHSSGLERSLFQSGLRTGSSQREQAEFVFRTKTDQSPGPVILWIISIFRTILLVWVLTLKTVWRLPHKNRILFISMKQWLLFGL